MGLISWAPRSEWRSHLIVAEAEDVDEVAQVEVILEVTVVEDFVEEIVEDIVVVTVEETVEDTVEDREEVSEIETVVSAGDQEDHQEEEEDSEEGGTMLVTVAGSETIDPAAEAMTIALHLLAGVSHRGTAMEGNSGAKAPVEGAVTHPAMKDTVDRDPHAVSEDLLLVPTISRGN